MSDSTSFLREGYDWSTSMLEAGGDDLPEVLRARLQLGIGGLLCIRLGRFDEARERLAEAREMFERLGNDRSLGWATFYEGIAGFGSVDLEQSIRTMEEAVRLHERAEDRFGRSTSTLLVGLYRTISDPASGRPYLERFQDWAAADGVPMGVAHANDSLAFSDALQDEVGEESQRRAAEALALFRDINNYACLCHGLGSASAVLGREGDIEGAARALGLADTIRDRLSMAIAPYEERDSYAREIAGELVNGPAWLRAVAEGRTFEPDEGIDWVISRLGYDPGQLGDVAPDSS